MTEAGEVGRANAGKILDTADYARRLQVSESRFRRARAVQENPANITRPWEIRLAARIAPPTRYIGSGTRRKTPVWLLEDIETFERSQTPN